jgi:hypothetical protein
MMALKNLSNTDKHDIKTEIGNDEIDCVSADEILNKCKIGKLTG